MKPTKITKLPSGLFTLATDPQHALSEEELREGLTSTITHAGIVEDIIQRAKRLR
jgi:hypothetical protein